MNFYKILVMCFFTPLLVQSQHLEEFNGPFKSWANVKTRFGAKGNGKTDDTKALQKALDELTDRTVSFNNKAGAYTIIYLPAGTYRISQTLELKGKIGISIIGEDPNKTIIKWYGNNKDTMFWSNGSAYFHMSRISWDPNGKKNMEGVGIHWKEKWRKPQSRSYASLNIEISDCYFLPGFEFGLGGGSFQSSGFTGQNDSEITVRRCRFFDCSYAGIAIRGHNALDYWIWDSWFIRCNLGISIVFGNYHAYRCYFKESKGADFHHSNGYYTSVRWCYSENSNAFSLDAGNSCNPFKRIYQGNIVVSPKEMPVEFYHLGRMTLFDNEFGQGKKPKHPYTINQNGWCPGVYAILAINNKFTSKQPVRIAPANKIQYFVNQDLLQKFSMQGEQFLKIMPPLPKKIKRLVFEVPGGAPGKIIQEIINKAAKTGQRTIIHFPPGDFYLDRSLVIPFKSYIQLLGDGYLYSSVITASKMMLERKEPLIIVKGPSYLVMKDLQLGSVSGTLASPIILFDNIDQPGSRVFVDQLYSLTDTSLYLKGNNYLQVQKENSFFADGDFIEGGRLLQQGKGTSKVIGFGGQFAKLQVNKKGEFIAHDIWWEGNVRVPLNLSGSGNVTIDGAMIAPVKSDSLTTIKINRFDGKISLLNIYLQGGIEVQPDNPGLQLFAWNINFYHKMNPVVFLQKRNSYKAWISGFTAQCFDKRIVCKGNPVTFGEYTLNINDKNKFIVDMTKNDRENSPMHYSKLPNGVSNVYLSRITTGKGSRGISFVNR